MCESGPGSGSPRAIPTGRMQSRPESRVDRSSQVEQADARCWPVVETLQSSALGLTMAVLGIAPRAVPAMLGACAVLTLIQPLIAGQRPIDVGRQVMQPLPMRLVLMLLGYALLSVLWSSDKGLAFLSVIQALAVALATGVLAALLPRQLAGLSPQRCRRFVRSIALGGGIAIAFVLFELATDNAVSVAVIRHYPSLMGDSAKEVVRDGNGIIGLQAFYLDRNVAALALAAPAILAAALIWARPVNAMRVASALLLAIITSIFLSHSEAAKLAAVAGIVAALAIVSRPATTVRALRFLLVGGVLLALPIGHLPSALGLEQATWLLPSARERAMIWDRTATAVRRAPLLGIGVQSTRFQSSPAATQIEGIRGKRRELGWHAHNFVLQTWLELGAVGALLLSALGLALAGAVARNEPVAQSAAVATLATAVAIAVTGWGIWQPWLLAAMGTAIVGLAVTQSGRHVLDAAPSLPAPWAPMSL